jgi:hypothetical protein
MTRLSLLLGLPILLGAFAFAAQETVTFEDKNLNLAFAHPKAWEVRRAGRDTTRFTIPIEGSTDKAILQVTRTEFRGSAESWQTIQQRINEQMKREVVRQWQQELGGVPLLMTRIRFAERGLEQNVLTGLLFTATRQKMLFRLSAPSADYDKAEFAFQAFLESIRSLDGSALVADDPSRPLPSAPTQQPRERPTAAPRRTTFPNVNQGAGTLVGPVQATLTIANRAMVLRLPDGWEATANSDRPDSVVLRHTSVSGEVLVTGYAIANSEPAATVLFRATAQDLNGFAKVDRRDDVVNRTTRSGMTLNAVWRVGGSNTGSLATLHATSANISHYLVVSYRLPSEPLSPTARGVLTDFLETLRIEPAP